ncbi:MAG: hypothetical protein F2653_03310 [Actinobacteria bacterium]|uniref:Unannotated protein n=1 Tax=freshwater metagenome TaxID=449393 RepID=A0A6J7RPU1_9ZZZZ|nr:hypothetical protein [Actinomycetota bacterium]MSW22563.1 hypothetical protein [Actinomycetota bacterium]MSX03751.1 hypothetical protein [Actinomycetota bacterium]MSX83853.1 hypothetical protein [Actinomycetota bacterium]MSY96446.1 hypothetical protein [Actinomycetota bacterium]
MKSQVALVGIGLVIASGVAYAELKPASNAPAITTVSTPGPVASSAPAEATAPTQTPAPKKSIAPKKSLVPKIAKPTISKPSISGGGELEDDDEREGGEDD